MIYPICKPQIDLRLLRRIANEIEGVDLTSTQKLHNEDLITVTRFFCNSSESEAVEHVEQLLDLFHYSFLLILDHWETLDLVNVHALNCTYKEVGNKCVVIATGSLKNWRYVLKYSLLPDKELKELNSFFMSQGLSKVL